MAARRDLTKKFAREYAMASKVDKGAILDALVAATGWTRDHARRAIRTTSGRKGVARDQQRKPRPRKFSYDASWSSRRSGGCPVSRQASTSQP